MGLRTSRPRGRCGLLALLLLVVSNCMPVVAHAERDVTIGLLLELSGPSVVNGLDCKSGFEVARASLASGDLVGARRVRFVYGDSQRDPKVGISEFRKMITLDHVSAVALLSSPIGMAVNPLSKAEKMPLVGVTGHADFIPGNPFAFRFWPSTAHEGSFVADRIADLGVKRVASITLEDDWCVSLSSHVKEGLKRRNVQLVLEEEIQGIQFDPASLVSRIRSAQADLVFVNVGIPQLPILFRRLYEQGIKSQLFSNTWAQKREVVDAAGREAMEGVLLETPRIDAPRFEAALMQRFPEASPNAIAFGCYAGLSLVLQALRESPQVNSSTALYEVMARIERVKLLDGALVIRGREAQFPLGVMEIRSGVANWMPISEKTDSFGRLPQ